MTRLFLFPSRLCLDAPLAAAGWAVCLAASRSGHPASPPLPETAGLFAAVWAIYLGDRLLDVFRARRNPTTVILVELPARHAWARARVKTLALLLALAVIFAATRVPFLADATLWAGLVVALATGLYFLVFRWSVPNRFLPRGMPAKELAIAFCFTAGAAFAAAPGALGTIPPLSLAALASLILGNCLLISRREAAHDAREDPAAYFSGGNGARLLPEFATGLALVLGVVSWGIDGTTPATLALVLVAAGTLILARAEGPVFVRYTQPIADGLHLLTWMVVALS